MTAPKIYLGLLRRKNCIVPTWKGWLLLLGIFVGTCMFVARGIYGFLAVNEPAPGGVLVVEGWSPDYVIEGAAAEFRRDGYKLICVTGGPIEFGNPLREYHTYAECGRELLVKFGVPAEMIHVVPAASVERDRTFASGVALKQWLDGGGTAERRINIVGNGSHSRRSLLLYRMALGSGFQIGISNAEEKGFDPKAWWKSSAGFRVVVDEAVAYFYARFVFSPPKQQP